VADRGDWVIGGADATVVMHMIREMALFCGGPALTAFNAHIERKYGGTSDLETVKDNLDELARSIGPIT
jgi:hypothetical protein